MTTFRIWKTARSTLQSHHTGIEMVEAGGIILDVTILQSHHTGIEIECTAARSRLPFSFNRTIPELKSPVPFKLSTTISILQSHHTGIEICVGRSLRLPLSVLQSHHTGIEMSRSSGMLCVASPLQSHHTGIEIEITIGTTHSRVGLQSHHTGIEMKFGGRSWFKGASFNRTIPELKFVGDRITLTGTDAFNRTIPELKSFR